MYVWYIFCFFLCFVFCSQVLCFLSFLFVSKGKRCMFCTGVWYHGGTTLPIPRVAFYVESESQREKTEQMNDLFF